MIQKSSGERSLHAARHVALSGPVLAGMDAVNQWKGRARVIVLVLLLLLLPPPLLLLLRLSKRANIPQHLASHTSSPEDLEPKARPMQRRSKQH